MQAVNNILQLLPLVLKMNHVRLCKYGTAARYTGRLLALQAKFDKVSQYLVNVIPGNIGFVGIHRGGQSLGLLIDERSGAGCAGTIAIEVFQFPATIVMIDLQKGSVLPPHADDCSNVRHNKNGAQDLADRLKFIKRPQVLTKLLSMVPGKRNRPDSLFPKFFIQVLNKSQNLFFHFAKMTFVGGFIDNLPLIVDDDTIQANGSCINAHIVDIGILGQFFHCNDPCLRSSHNNLLKME